MQEPRETVYPSEDQAPWPRDGGLARGLFGVAGSRQKGRSERTASEGDAAPATAEAGGSEAGSGGGGGASDGVGVVGAGEGGVHEPEGWPEAPARGYVQKWREPEAWGGVGGVAAGASGGAGVDVGAREVEGLVPKEESDDAVFFE